VTDGEAELIRRAQAHDTDAFCALAERHQRRIFLLAFHYCQNAQDAEDLSQDVWLKAYRALNTFRFDSSFYTWLRRITLNTFLNDRRASPFRWLGQKNDVEIEEASEENHFESEEPIYSKVLFDSVLNALAELTPSQRLMFLLRHYEGMTYEEIASAMNCSSGTAKKAVWRALSKLRIRLEIADEAPDKSLARLAAEY